MDLLDQLRGLVEELARDADVDPQHALIGLTFSFVVWMMIIFGGCLAARRSRQDKGSKPDAAPAGGLADATREMLRSVSEAAPPDCCVATYQGEEVAASQLKPKKELGTAYVLLFLTGYTGAQHFYLDRWMHGLVCLYTLNLFGLGLVMDVYNLPSYVRQANEEVAEQARTDGTSRRICTRLPIPCCGIFAILACVLGGLPLFLQSSNLMDFEQVGAGTERNPFDVLGLQRGSSAAKVNAAYSTKMKTFRARSTCDKECRTEKEELRKARLFALGKGWKSGVSRKEFREPEEQSKPVRGRTTQEQETRPGAAKQGASNDDARREQRREQRRDPYVGQRRPDWDDWAAWKVRNPSPFGAFASVLGGLHGDKDRVGASIKMAEEAAKRREMRTAAQAAERAQHVADALKKQQQGGAEAGAEAGQQPRDAEAKPQTEGAETKEQVGVAETKRQPGGAEVKQPAGGDETKPQPEAAETKRQPGGAEKQQEPLSQEEELRKLREQAAKSSERATPKPPEPKPAEKTQPKTPQAPEEIPVEPPPPVQGSTRDWEGKDWIDYTFHAWEIIGGSARETITKYVDKFDSSSFTAGAAWSEEL